MKKTLLPLLALTTIIGASLLPVSVAKAVSYEPGYTCQYRDIAGSCLSYQTQNPYFFTTGNGGLYGNRQTYPFRAMFNAQSTNKHLWDNHYNNKRNYYHALTYEEDDGDNNYLDDDDDAYKYYHGGRDDGDGDWRWYFNEDDNTYNRYRYQSGNNYTDGYGYGRRHHKNTDNYYEEYEYTRYYCTGGDCNSTYFRY